jgi:hypothetical protein
VEAEPRAALARVRAESRAAVARVRARGHEPDPLVVQKPEPRPEPEPETEPEPELELVPEGSLSPENPTPTRRGYGRAPATARQLERQLMRWRRMATVLLLRRKHALEPEMEPEPKRLSAKLRPVKITSGTLSSLRESPSWTAGGLHHRAAARGPDGTRGFVGTARAAKALTAAREELATARALAPADARARALPDYTRYSNDSIVYEIAPGPDGALRPREVPPRDRTSNLPPPP